MYLTQLSLLNLDLRILNKLNDYLNGLSLSARERITFSSLQKDLDNLVQQYKTFKSCFKNGNNFDSFLTNIFLFLYFSISGLFTFA